MTLWYLARRLGLALLSIFGVVVITFTLSHVVPGDPAVIAAGRVADPKVVARIRDEMGLDHPLHIQFATYLRRLIIEQDLGRSIISHRPVADDLKAYFPATLELITISMVFITVLGILTGVLSALKRDSPFDYTVRVLALSGLSMPEFWLAIVLQLLFTAVIIGFPIDGRVSLMVLVRHPLETRTGLYLVDSLLQGNWPVFGSAILHLILPVVTLTFAYMAQVTRITRAAMIEVLNQDCIRTARAVGVGPIRLILKHALRNALIPILTMMGMIYGYLLGGTILIESVFSWPGLGRYVVQAIFRLDFPGIMGVTILGATIVVFLNLLVDALCAVVNPTIKYT